MVISLGAPDLIPIDFLLRGTYGPHQLRTKAQGLMPKIHRPSLMLFPIQTAHSCFLKPHLPNQKRIFESHESSIWANVDFIKVSKRVKMLKGEKKGKRRWKES